jgi:hypothetical protein
MEHLVRAGIADSARAQFGLPWDKAFEFAAWYLEPRHGRTATGRSVRYSVELVRQWRTGKGHRAWLFGSGIGSVWALLRHPPGRRGARTWVKQNCPTAKPPIHDPLGRWSLSPFVTLW